MRAVKHLSAESFDREVRREGPVLVDFHASWCGPWRAHAPVLERLAAGLGERLTIVKVDIDAEPELAARFEIESIPTLSLFENGTLTQTVRGFSVPALRSLLGRALRPRPAQAVERGDLT